MTRKYTITLVLILIIFAFSLWALLPLQADKENPVEKLGRTELRFGLDLTGGVHLVYEADATENATELDRNMKRTVTTIQKRIDKYGVAEPVSSNWETTGYSYSYRDSRISMPPRAWLSRPASSSSEKWN